MNLSKVYPWILKSPRRKLVLLNFSQPLTANQMSKRTGLSLDACSYVFWEFTLKKLSTCLNNAAQRNRVYWLSRLGLVCRRRSFRDQEKEMPTPFVPDVDWDLYGQVCHRHRSAIIKALREPMQPAAAKRRARALDPTLRMSGNNARDVMRWLRKAGLVDAIREPGARFPKYRLLQMGEDIRSFIQEALYNPLSASSQKPFTRHTTSL
ncbi:MAG: hypothetical protein FLDDKLPJ_03610 [Phycisphaerae bacterium]|nr:hypothetical protein [Phycisphaerae bacterium]